MAKGIQIPIGVKLAPLKKGLASARKMLGSVGKGVALGGAAVGVAGLAGGMIALRKTIIGVKEAFDTGGSLSDLSAMTGIAVKDLDLLTQAFEDNGLAAAQVPTTIQKMQRSLSDARSGLSTQVRALDRINLSYEDLMGMDPAAQFQLIQERISALPDPLDRSATALELFGRAGGQLLTLFADGDAFKNAAVTLGRQSELLQKNAGIFDRISDLLSSAGKKLRGFFIGIASKVAPMILSALEKFNKLDMAAWGEKIGTAFGVVIEAFRQGKAFSLAMQVLKLGFMSGVNYLYKGMQAAVAFLGATLPPIMESAWSKLKDPVFWQGVWKLFKSVGAMLRSIFYEIRATMSKGENDRRLAEGQKQNASILAGHAQQLMTDAGDGKSFADVLGKSIGEGLKSAGKTFKESSGLLELRDLQKQLRQQYRQLRQDSESRNSSSPEKPDVSTSPQTKATLAGIMESTAQLMRPVVSSMVKVGGASSVRTGRSHPLHDMAKERNKKLDTLILLNRKLRYLVLT